MHPEAALIQRCGCDRMSHKDKGSLSSERDSDRSTSLQLPWQLAATKMFPVRQFCMQGAINSGCFTIVGLVCYLGY